MKIADFDIEGPIAVKLFEDFVNMLDGAKGASLVPTMIQALEVLMVAVITTGLVAHFQNEFEPGLCGSCRFINWKTERRCARIANLIYRKLELERLRQEDWGPSQHVN